MKKNRLSAKKAFELIKSVKTKGELVKLAKEYGMDLDEERADEILKEFSELQTLDEERISELNGGCCSDCEYKVDYGKNDCPMIPF